MMRFRNALSWLVLAGSMALGQCAWAQWEMQISTTVAGLRGIRAVGGGVAWASGTDGTVLRTEDSGFVWQGCAVPKGAEKLDFRGIWAWDANRAVVMSSGPGDKSRIYKTVDGCKSWKLETTNPDEKGFWDALVFVTERQGFVLGDPVDGKFAIYTTRDGGETWAELDDPGLEADAKGEGAFAASNSSLITKGPFFWFGTSGPGGPHVFHTYQRCSGAENGGMCAVAWSKVKVPLAGSSAAAGVFSLAARNEGSPSGKTRTILVAVGGDYEKPKESDGTAAWSGDGGVTWTAAEKPPSGYRSSVVYRVEDRDSGHGQWIAAGTSGSDVSLDDGKTWKKLDAGNWNALSVAPDGGVWAVGPKGRIGKLAGK